MCTSWSPVVQDAQTAMLPHGLCCGWPSAVPYSQERAHPPRQRIYVTSTSLPGDIPVLKLTRTATSFLAVRCVPQLGHRPVQGTLIASCAAVARQMVADLGPAWVCLLCLGGSAWVCPGLLRSAQVCLGLLPSLVFAHSNARIGSIALLHVAAVHQAYQWPCCNLTFGFPSGIIR